MPLAIPPSDKIEALIRDITAAEIMPRFQTLSKDEKWEKRPGSVVTAADVAAEEFLDRKLPPLLPGSVVVGEEMIEDDPAALDLLDGDAPVWVLDAVDGTSNFAKGSPDFGVMVALVLKRETVAGWIFRPVDDDMYVCEKGAGAFRNGERLTIAASPREMRNMEGSLGGYMRKHTDLPDRVARVTSTRCIAVDYCALVNNDIHFAHYRGVRAWDHAPGWLLHTEAGGFNRCLDGSDYLAGKPGEGGILLATDEEAWETLQHPIVEAIASFK
jgi:fructose-1,6-bisphosphatase/inositol monophosphatase family enzyme